MKSASEVPEISLGCILEDNAVVANLKYDSHQNDDVLMPQFAVNANLPPQLGCNSVCHAMCHAVISQSQSQSQHSVILSSTHSI